MTEATLANILEPQTLEIIMYCMNYFSLADKASWPSQLKRRKSLFGLRVAGGL